MKIDKNIAIPGFGAHNAKYPFRIMQIGDSFAVDIADRTKVSTACTKFGKDNPEFKFTLRHFEGAYRCWRIPAEVAS